MEYAASPPPPPPATPGHAHESWQYANELQHQVSAKRNDTQVVFGFLTFFDLKLFSLNPKLKAAHDRQRYLEDIIRSQASQIEQAQIYGPDTNKAIETMRSVYMMAVSLHDKDQA